MNDASVWAEPYMVTICKIVTAGVVKRSPACWHREEGSKDRLQMLKNATCSKVISSKALMPLIASLSRHRVIFCEYNSCAAC